MMALTPRKQLDRGVLTASAGNMAQGVAFCARRLGIQATIVAPDTAPATKILAVERLGGRVIKVPFAEWWQTFERRSYPGVDATFIHAFDDPHVMAGNSTIALELLEDLPDLDAVVIPWGGGGLACGIASVLRALAPQVRIYAAEIETAAPLAPSLAAGEPLTVDYRPSFVDGIGSKTVFANMFERARKLLDGSLVVTLDHAAQAMKLVAERNRVIVAASKRTNARWIEMGRVEVRDGSVSQLPFPDGMFDLVTAVETHFWWPDLPADMCEIFRVLKTGGKLIVIAEVYKGANTSVAKLAERFASQTGMKLLSVDEHRQLFADAGYSDVQIIEERDKGWICGVGRKS